MRYGTAFALGKVPRANKDIEKAIAAGLKEEAL